MDAQGGQGPADPAIVAAVLGKPEEDHNTNVDSSDDELYVDENDGGEVISDEDDAAIVDGVAPMDSDDDEEVDMNDAVVVVDQSRARFLGHARDKGVMCVALNPSVEHIVLSCGEDDASFVWDGQTGETLVALPRNEESVIAGSFNHDGSMFATADMNGVITVYETEGEQLQRIEAGEEVMSLNWHSRGNWIVAGTISGLLWLCMVPNGHIMTLGGHSDAANQAIFTPDGKNILSVSEDGTLIKWDPKTGAVLFRTSPTDERFNNGPISSVAMHPEKAMIATGGRNGSVRLINATNGKLIAAMDDFEDSVESIVFCTPLKLMAACSVDGTIKVYNTNTFIKLGSLTHDDAVTKLLFSQNAQNRYLLYSSSLDAKCKCWDVRNMTLVREWTGHHGGILDFALASDGDTIVTASDDGTCAVFYSHDD